jgi:hypothetical protein
MRVLVQPINLKKHRERFTVYLAGDLHLGDKDCDEDAWARLISEVKTNPGVTRLILMGDYIYNFPKHDSRNWGKKPTKSDVLDLYTGIRDSLKPIRNRISLILAGNHDYDWMKAEGIDFVNWLCAELGVPYGGYESYLRYKVKGPGEQGRNFDVLAWHGFGGGRTVGGAFNKVRNPIDVFREPSVVAMGHLHRLGFQHEQYMAVDEKRLDVVSTDQYFVLTGGYQKGYAPPESSYISMRMLPPVAIGAMRLSVQPFRDVGGRDVLDVQFSEVR